MNAQIVLRVACVAVGSAVAMAQPTELPPEASRLPATFGAPPAAPGQVVDVSSQLAALVADGRAPGVAVALVDSQGILAHGAAGLRRAGGPEPVTLDDRWHLGSCGKAMTATLVGLMVADGTFRWDTSIGEVLNPGRDPKKQITNNWRLPTVRQLITCTANVPQDLGERGGRSLWGQLWDKARAEPAVPALEQRAFLLEELIKSNIGAPTTGFSYANASLSIAGHLCERAAGEPFEALMRRRVFQPLGMDGAGFGAPGTPGGETADQPWGHARDGSAVPPGITADNPPGIAPAGTMHMRIDDWARFAQMHLIGARVSGAGREADGASEPDWDPRLTLGLGPSDFAVLHAPGSPYGDYAGGWIVATRSWAKGEREGDTGRCLTHAGSNTMWTASIWIAPEIDRAVLAVVNTGAPAGSHVREDALLMLINHDREARGLKPIKP